MKREISDKIYKKVFNYTVDSTNLNKKVKAVVLKLNDREAIVYNDNFGTNHKYMDFTNGKIKAGLHPMQICFSSLEVARIFGDEYIDENDNRRKF